MTSFLSLFTHENITSFFESYKAFGPIVAILLPLIEAFLPFLPLVAFAVANAMHSTLGRLFINLDRCKCRVYSCFFTDQKIWTDENAELY